MTGVWLFEGCRKPPARMVSEHAQRGHQPGEVHARAWVQCSLYSSSKSKTHGARRRTLPDTADTTAENASNSLDYIDTFYDGGR